MVAFQRAAANKMAPLVQGKARADRVLWSDDSVRAFIHGVFDYGVGNWAVIAKKCITLDEYHRRGVHLKDKWRWLENKVIKA